MALYALQLHRSSDVGLLFFFRSLFDQSIINNLFLQIVEEVSEVKAVKRTRAKKAKQDVVPEPVGRTPKKTPARSEIKAASKTVAAKGSPVAPSRATPVDVKGRTLRPVVKRLSSPKAKKISGNPVGRPRKKPLKEGASSVKQPKPKISPVKSAKKTTVPKVATPEKKRGRGRKAATSSSDSDGEKAKEEEKKTKEAAKEAKRAEAESRKRAKAAKETTAAKRPKRNGFYLNAPYHHTF